MIEPSSSPGSTRVERGSGSAASPAVSRRGRRWILFGLGVLLIASLAMRIWFSTYQANENRDWDEQFGMKNVVSVVQSGDWEPENAFYPALHHLPQTVLILGLKKLSDATGWSSLDPVSGDRFNSTGYIAARSVEAIYGTATILLVFVIGRRIFGPGVGLLAAFLLSVTPWHLHVSSNFKPDGLLVFTVTLTFWLSLLALERPSLWRFVAAGAAVGLAVSAKYNGIPAALPVAFAALANSRQLSLRRSLTYLAAAGAAAVMIFFAVNPYALLDPQLYVGSFSKTLQDYHHKGRTIAGGSHLAQYWHALRALPSRFFHGRVVGVLAIVGLGTLIGHGIQHAPSSLHRKQRLMILVYILGYVSVYALVTANPFEQNWVPLLPFSSLLAAWVIVGVVRAGAARLSAKWRTRLAILVLGSLVGWLGVSSYLFVYRVITPSTIDLALNLAVRRVGSLSGRYVMTDEWPKDAAPRHGTTQLMPLKISLADPPPSQVLDRSDAEVYRQSPDSDLAREGLALRLGRQRGGRPYAVRPALFQAWGPAIVVLKHPLKRGSRKSSIWLQPRTPGASGRAFEGSIDRDLQGRLVSVDLWFASPVAAGVPDIDLKSGSEAGRCGYVRVKGRERHARCSRIVVGDRLTVTMAGQSRILPDRVAADLEDWHLGPALPARRR